MLESRTQSHTRTVDTSKDIDRRNDYLNRLLAANASSYDIQKNYSFEGRTFPAFAEFHTFGEQYVLAKRAKLWEVNSHDFMFYSFSDYLDSGELDRAVSFVCEKAISKVEHGKNHMSSALTLIIIADGIAHDIAAHVRKTRFRKNYLGGIHGWSDLRLAVVNLGAADSREAIITNGAGKSLKKMLEANLLISVSN